MMENRKCSKTEPTFFVKNILFHRSIFEAIPRKLYPTLGSASTGGVEKFSKKSGAKKSDPHSVRMPCPCWIWAIAASWSWGNFQTELVGRFGEWKTNFFGIFGLLKPPNAEEKRWVWRLPMGDEKQMESSLNWSEMLGLLLHSTDSSSPMYSSF